MRRVDSPSTLALVLTLVVGLGACDGGDPPSDGGTSDADAGPGVAPPEIPWLADGLPPVTLTPCPDGWREVLEEGITACAPYPEGGSAECAAGEAHFPGESGCRPIGEPCPSSDFAPSLPTDGSVVYVKADAAPGGDGSLASPYAALSDVAWFSLAAGTTVALAKGSYEGTLPLKAGIRVVGACVAETILTGTSTPASAVVSITSSGEPAVVTNVSIVGAEQQGAVVDQGRALELDGVLVERASGTGVLAIDRGSSIDAVDLVIRGTQPSDLLAGRGVHVQDGARLGASRAIIDDNGDIGVSVMFTGSEITLADVVIRDTRPNRAGVNGTGITVLGGARLDASRLLVEGNHQSGVDLRDPETEVGLADVVIRDTRSVPLDGALGRGINMQDGPRLTALRVLVSRNRDLGVYLSGESTSASFEDVLVTHTAVPENDEERADGVGVHRGAALEATRLVIARTEGLGLLVSAADATFTDVAVVDTLPRSRDGSLGRGANFYAGADVTANRVLIARSLDLGVLISDPGTTVELADIVIRDTSTQQSNLRAGFGLNVQLDAVAHGERVVVERSHGVGVYAFGNATMELTDTTIAGVDEVDCGCPEGADGHGAAASDATLRLTRFNVADAHTCGLFVVSPGGATMGAPLLDARAGVVERNAIGACVQVDPYDLESLMREVVYRDNGVNLDTTMLPVPAPAETL